jgi:S-layer homology domain/Protein of unknown function (DUF1565)
MPDKKSEPVPKTTPDNWDVLQNLFLGRKQLTEEHPKLDNWDVLKSLFGISKSSPGNPPVDPGTDPQPPTNDIEAAKQAAEAAQRAAESAKSQAEMARTGAESAKTAAESAKSQAETARTGAESAKTAAESAKSQAETARTGAESAKSQAETARTGAESAKTAAESAKSQAETARTGAELAKSEAEMARTDAKAAQRAAEIAKTEAETALQKADLLPIPIEIEKVVAFVKKHGVKLLVAAIAFMLLLIFLGRAFRRQKPVSPSNSTIYIDPVNGSDRNDGTNKAPFKTLPHALKKTAPGDTVHFFPGSYNTDIREDEPMVIPANVGIAIHPNSSRQLFSDIQNHWAAEFIEALAVKGIIKGFKDGKFRPDEPLTRAQYAAILSNAFDLPKPKNIKKFQDVKSNFWAYQAIQKNYSQKFLQGFPNNRFYPNGNVKRVQAIAAIVSGSALASENDTRELMFYDDWKDIPDWAITQVATATPKQLIVNYPDPKRLNPTQNATRAEVAVMIYQSMVTTGQLPAIKSIYIPHSAP